MRETAAERLEDTDIQFAILRAVVAGGAIGWIHLAPLPVGAKEGLIILAAGFTGYSAILYVALCMWTARRSLLYTVAVLLDLCLLATLVKMTGGIHSDFFLGFYLPVAVFAFYEGLTRGVLLSLGASVIYLAGVGWPGTPAAPLADLMLRLGFLLLVAVAVGMLAERKQKDLANIQSLNSDLAVERDRLGKAYSDLQEAQTQVLRSEQLAAIGRLAAGIAHEVNNPVASIATCVEGLERRVRGRAKILPEELEDLPAYLDVMKKAAFRCKEITGKLLTFSQRGDSDLPEEVDLDETVDETIGLVAYEAEREGIRIDRLTDGRLPDLLGNRTELGQVCLNLFINAMDAMPTGGVLTVATRSIWSLEHEQDPPVMARECQAPTEGSPAGWVEVSVSDTGVGMTEDTRSRIFEPFFTTKPVGKGTGLGLTICSQLVRKWGGQISAESGLGEGSTIRVLFPVGRNPEREGT